MQFNPNKPFKVTQVHKSGQYFRSVNVEGFGEVEIDTGAFHLVGKHGCTVSLKKWSDEAKEIVFRHENPEEMAFTTYGGYEPVTSEVRLRDKYRKSRVWLCSSEAHKLFKLLPDQVEFALYVIRNTK